MSKRHPILAFLGAIWKVIDGIARLAINLLVIFFVVLVIGFLFSPTAPRVPSSAALVLAPAGNLVEQLAGNPLDRAIGTIVGDVEPQTRVRDLVDAIQAARDDDRIEVLVLDLDEMFGAGLSKLQTIGIAIEDFKTSGKKVIALGDAYAQNQYYLAAYADEIYMHPMGIVFMQGYGRFRIYYKEAIDKLGIDWNVFKVGEYKSFVEPYTRQDMSAEDRASSLAWLTDLWEAYQQDVDRNRALEPGSVERYVTGFVDDLEQVHGDFSAIALEHGLVDELRDRVQMRERLVELVGEDPDTGTFRQIHHENYLQAVRFSESLVPDNPNKVALIVASGEILPGDRPPGTIGGTSLARLIRQVHNDDSVRAVVLQIDSGGGSTFASEVIYDELRALKADKPVIASMSSTAASGGYYIAMGADEVWAHPTTLTGSIGIFAMFPTFQRTLEKIGLSVDGVGTTEFSGAFRPDRALNESVGRALQLSIENGYEDFIGLVAEARGLEPDAVDRVARGRVWPGATAEEIGLVDRLGTVEDAIGRAASLANLDDYSVTVFEEELSYREQLFLELVSRTKGWFGTSLSGRRSLQERMAFWLDTQLGKLARFEDPSNLYYYCFCEID